MRLSGRVVLALSCLAGAGLLASCASPSGSDKKGQEEAPEKTPLASSTIGVSGGTLYTGEFSLVIPSAAFSAGAQVSVYDSPVDSGFGDRALSPQYEIRGLPAGFAVPCTLRIKASVPAGDTPFVALGSDACFRSGKETALGWTLYEAAQDSGGWLRMVITTERAGLGKAGQAMAGAAGTVAAVAVGNTGVDTSAAGHFRVTYPKDSITQQTAAALLGWLEEAHAHYAAMGFPYTGRTVWPLEVTLKAMPMHKYGSFFAKAASENTGAINLNSRRVRENDTTHAVAAHETFHLAQYHCDRRPAAQKWDDFGSQYWIDEATAAWAEGVLLGDSAWVSVTRPTRELYVLSGMVPPAGAAEGPHGYSLSSMIKYLVDLHGDHFIIGTYRGVIAGRHATASLYDSVPAPISGWWDAYLSGLLKSDIYHEVKASWFDAWPAAFLPGSAADTARNFAAVTPELSGLVYRIAPASDALLSGKKVTCSVAGGACGITAFCESGGLLFPIATGSGSLSVADAGSYLPSSCGVLFLVSNHHATPPLCNGLDTVRTAIRISEDSSLNLSGFTQASVNLTYEAQWNTGTVLQQGLLIQARNGSYSGGTFTAFWDSTETSGMRYAGSFTAVVDPDAKTVTSWSVSNRWIYTAPNTYNLYETNGSGAAVPLYYQSATQARFLATGAAGCAGVSRIYVEQVSDGVTTKVLNGFACNANSSISITFLK